jgi:flavin reductase (DIM6/NTAB) family NADH-FMN oxidoreductase RutF
MTFRRVLGTVPTAVSVVTVVDASGSDQGMTVGTFTSLSLQPPLVLICIGDDSTIAPAMAAATHFGLSALDAAQEHLSTRFADRELRSFDGIAATRGPLGTLLLDGTVARLECRIVARHPGGDHTIVVGQVEFADASEGAPLVHHRGGYRRLGP